jgi:hypothetical protein
MPVSEQQHVQEQRVPDRADRIRFQANGVSQVREGVPEEEEARLVGEPDQRADHGRERGQRREQAMAEQQ